MLLGCCWAPERDPLTLMTIEQNPAVGPPDKWHDKDVTTLVVYEVIMVTHEVKDEVPRRCRNELVQVITVFFSREKP